MKSTIIGVLIAISASAEAQIYKWKDAKGLPQYSESPPHDKPYETVPDNISYGDGTRTAVPRYVPNQSTKSEQSGSIIHSAYPYHQADWETCSKNKKSALAAEARRQSQRAESLNEWLWKNCREYSNELRAIEQQLM